MTYMLLEYFVFFLVFAEYSQLFQTLACLLRLLEFSFALTVLTVLVQNCEEVFTEVSGGVLLGVVDLVSD